MRGARERTVVALVCLGLVVAGCARSGPPEPTPWAHRPVVDLHFDVAKNLRSATGHERVVFTPDLRTCDLVFRLWPNKPATASAGSSLTVSSVRVDGETARSEDVAAGAPDSAPAGTLLEIPLANCADAGQKLTVDLDFALRLGPDVDERVGMSADGEVAWFGTGFPLLAWERGLGWARDPAVPVAGEMAVSEDFRLNSLEVVAPSDYEVLGTGTAAGTADGPDAGTTVHRFTAPAVRDVAVSVGALDVEERTIDGIRVHVGVDAAATDSDPAAYLDRIATSIRDLEKLLGSFPYPDLWVSVLSSESSGIEFPGAIQVGDVDPDRRRALMTHELAHQWFYGLVGNDQAEHPWLDESFATFAQMVADGEERTSTGDIPRAYRKRVGEPISYWTQDGQPSDAYYDAVYIVGGAALVTARDRAGHQAFDKDLQDYLRANAFTIATPDDVRAAFADLPEVLTVLRGVGALR
ncbi:MAG TPA: M1 family aminopeptidase [Blastococcus sp.]